MTRVTHRKVKTERLQTYCDFCGTFVKSDLPEVVTFPEPGHMIETKRCPYCDCLIHFATDMDVLYWDYPRKHVTQNPDGSFTIFVPKQVDA
jgi:hypothetical protein